MSKALHNILYVEDEPDIRRVVQLALEAVGGMQVLVCGSGAEAIARAPAAEIDLILLDVMMPEMDGPTTLIRLREIPALAQTPVVFMTAKAHPDEIAHFKALGALEVIAKPFDPLTLAETLRNIWAQSTAVISARQTFATQPAGGRTVELTPEQRFAARMAELTVQFERELPLRLATLREQWLELQGSWSLDGVDALHGSVHNLAGAGATFGYDEVTTRARALDRHLKLLLAEQRQPDTLLRVEISALFVELEAELRRIVLQLGH